MPVVFTRYSNRKDRSVVLSFETGEQTPNDIAGLHSMLDVPGFLYFKAEHELTDAEKTELDSLDREVNDNAKSRAQRMRAVLYRLWEKEPKGFAQFKDYYAYQMDAMIRQLKDRLAQLDV